MSFTEAACPALGKDWASLCTYLTGYFPAWLVIGAISLMVLYFTLRKPFAARYRQHQADIRQTGEDRETYILELDKSRVGAEYAQRLHRISQRADNKLLPAPHFEMISARRNYLCYFSINALAVSFYICSSYIFFSIYL